MVDDMEAGMVADIKVDMVADMEVDNGLGAFASPNFFKPTLSRLAHLLSFTSLILDRGVNERQPPPENQIRSL